MICLEKLGVQKNRSKINTSIIYLCWTLLLGITWFIWSKRRIRGITKYINAISRCTWPVCIVSNMLWKLFHFEHVLPIALTLKNSLKLRRKCPKDGADSFKREQYKNLSHFDDNSMANFYFNNVVTHVISIRNWNLLD